MMLGEPLVVVTQAVKLFEAGKETIRALDGFSMELHAGHLCALVGVSGSGKSTLLGALGGLVRLDSGEMIVDGRQINGLDEEELARYRRETVATVFQEYNLLPMLTAAENIELAMHLIGVPEADAHRESRSALGALSMEDLADRLPSDMSGGQRQRVAIARALVGQGMSTKRLLLADEPSGSLDEGATRAVIDSLRKAADRGLAVLVATHDPIIVEQCDVVIGMRDGRVAGEQQGVPVA